METKIYDFDSFECHSDAGDYGLEITCPNCAEKVRFADHQWWRSECECGEWMLEQVAKLTPSDASEDSDES